MTVGQKIIFYRNILGISQRGLAKKSGLTAPAISQYENEKRTPDLKSFITICKSFGVNLDKFMEDVSI
ncbi:MAG: helix-turn-helix domain-containing protein [Clostridium sp.]|uniref:helix-turn-helix domain-containing protein n=1 Tax=Clostridium sp. TaxID=1506 RepID=UPI003D6CC816